MPEQKRATNPHVERLALKIVEQDLNRIAREAHARSPHLAHKWSDARIFVDDKQRKLDRGGPLPPGGGRRRDREPAPDDDLDPSQAQWQPEPAHHQGVESSFGRLVRELWQLIDGSSADRTATQPAWQGPPQATPGAWQAAQGPWQAAPAPVPTATPYGLPLHDSPIGGQLTSELDEAVLRSQLTEAVDSMLKESPALRELYDRVDLPTVSQLLKGRADGVEATPERAETGLDRTPAEPTVADMAALTSPNLGRSHSSRSGSEVSVASVASLRSSPDITRATPAVSPSSRQPSIATPGRRLARG
ncbi:hypothetical protein [Micromonospora sp. NRRL B-16802]|uniref:hypothetical protein n=1 Tax=Micromonospora sp. NRRL B-16802 TaxID=1415541 RepID=UPI000ACC91B9|nr:hypothetical protein [Micromonospora sp. NRRL B-16802]